MARAASKPVKEPLSRERIELAALELIEEDGLAGFSTRKLATRLGYEAMSIYHYFPSKGHLMDALVDRIVGSELTVLVAGAAPWRQQLVQSAREWRQMALAHPALYLYLALHRFNTPTALRWLNGILGVVGSSGLPHERAVRMFRAIGSYLIGTLLDETAGYQRGPSTVAPVPPEVMARDFPEVVAAGRWFAESEREATFVFGLNALLDGIESELAKRR